MRGRIAFVVVVAWGLAAGGSAFAGAAAAPPVVDIAPALDALREQLAAVAVWGREARPALQLEEVQIDLQLVEFAGGSTLRLAIPYPAADPAASATAKPALRRHLSISLTPPRDLARAGQTKTGNLGAGSANGTRSADISDAAPVPAAAAAFAAAPRVPSGPGTSAAPSSRHAASAAPRSALVPALAGALAATQMEIGAGALEAKRVVVDLEFFVEPDAHGTPAIIVFAGDRRADPRLVQKLRLKLSRQAP